MTGLDLNPAARTVYSVGPSGNLYATTGNSNDCFGNIGIGTVIGLTAGVVPEPASWAMLIIGFGLVGVTMRRRTRVTVAA